MESSHGLQAARCDREPKRAGSETGAPAGDGLPPAAFQWTNPTAGNSFRPATGAIRNCGNQKRNHVPTAISVREPAGFARVAVENALKTMCILKISPALKLLIGLVTAFVLTVPSAGGADWRSLGLSGTFSDAKEDATDMVLDTAPDGHLLLKGYARGSGLTSYSLSSGELVDDNSGDLILLVRFTVPKATAANFSVAAGQIVDLGPLMPLPANIKLPKKRWFSHPYNGPRRMVIGNYYYVVQSGQHLIIQPTAFEVSNVQINDNIPGLYGDTLHVADCALKARFLSASTLTGLRQLNKELPSPKSSP
jgi:hypothetical protein